MQWEDGRDDGRLFQANVNDDKRVHIWLKWRIHFISILGLAQTGMQLLQRLERSGTADGT